MDVDSCFELGYVIKPHGLNGEVSIHIDADDPDQYQDLESVFVLIDQKLVPFFLEHIVVQHNGKALVKFEDVNTVENARELQKRTLHLPLSMLPELEDNQFYYHEIISYQVIDHLLGEVGDVKEVYTFPGQDLIAVDHRGNEVLIPVSDEIIEHVDRTTRQLMVRLPDGLLEVYNS